MTNDAGRQRVLVIEDERTINQALADRLVAEGFDVRQAYDGPWAVVAARPTGRGTSARRCWSASSRAGSAWQPT
jgi:DNA-binding NtrC family response regulator